ncbi:hypothetical protein DWW15_05615 [Subdoligranulum sp. AF14-43]|nr:hypothetical protein DWW15_05615 [Subdoligranulum sp. AF14-43]
MRRILQVLPFFARRAGVSCVRCMGRARCRAFPPLGGGMEIWYNNLKAAACAAARVHGTRPCADAQGFENIGPCKTAAGAVLLWPLRGVMV